MRIARPGVDAQLHEEDMGGKAYNLARMAAAGFDVPPFFVVTAEAFREATRHLTSDDPEAMIEGIDALELPAALVEEIERTLDALGMRDDLLAVRSSAIGEDGGELSYAGQLESYLFVRHDRLAECLRNVWRSAFSERVRAYRRSNELAGGFPSVAVIVQRMIDAEVSGVAFGIDPVSGDRTAIVISALFGLGEGLVSKGLDADTYTVRGDAIESRIVMKETAIALDRERGSSTISVPVPSDMRERPALGRSEINAIAERTRELRRLFGAPQDVEWCIAAGKLYLLQSRPITSLRSTPDTTGRKILWDNSNIIESYAGVTTPLTFSFVRGVYSEVYREFCRIMGVDEGTIDRNAGIFEMLGLIRGRIYYNLLNWYRVLALLPGYAINARFMEQMMGVREQVEESPSIVASGKNPYIRLGISIYRLVANLRALPENIREFQKHLDATLAPLEETDLTTRRPEELVSIYLMLQDSLLRRWRVPILNDFYTMIFFGLLKRSIEKWKIDESGTLHNDLLSGEGGIISTEPLRAIRMIANTIVGDAALRGIVERSTDDASLVRELKGYPEVWRGIEEYIRKFGDRYVGELKLETITPRENPALLVRLIAGYVRQGYIDPDRERNEGATVRESAEKLARKKIGGAFRKTLFAYLLRQTRERVKNRENLRFERTRVFGVVRRLFAALGEYLHAEGRIDSPRDIFYLTKEEIFSFIDGTAVTADLRGLARLRREELERYRDERTGDRFATYGVVYIGNSFTEPVEQSRTGSAGSVISGIPCSPGIVRAPVRRVVDPDTAPSLEGAILVAERTDPGWAPLFPMASGLLVERGSLLSHSAIVAREMGIPAIVGIPGLMERLNDGDVVEMNGATGEVRVLS